MTESLKNYMTRKKRSGLFFMAGLLGLLLVFGFLVNFDLLRIFRGLPSMFDLIARMLRPNFSYLGEVGEKLLETLEIALVSALVGLVLAMPMSILISKNIAPSSFLWRGLNIVFALARTIPALVWAAILVSIFSIGKFSGIMALSISSFLVALKLYKDYIEGMEENLLNSTRAVGASNFQVLKFCVFPSILEQTISIFFMVLEINIRGAAVLGFVGAGGIGQIMWRNLNHLRYDNLSTLILVLLLLIFLIDMVSLFFRSRIRNLTFKFSDLGSYRTFKGLKNFFFFFLVLGLVFLTYRSLSINHDRLVLGLGQGLNILKRMARPDLSYMGKLVQGLMESLAIAVFATIMGGLVSLVLTYFASYNMGGSSLGLGVSKFFINLLRTFPSIVTAIILFRGVGPGPLAGALALSIYTSGVLTKQYSEVVEALPGNLLESLKVTGADRLAIYRQGVLPASLPNFISLLLYRLESNIRNSTILGIIGAGGVGTSLTMNINWRNWERVGLLILGIGLTVFLIDQLSNWIRTKL